MSTTSGKAELSGELINSLQDLEQTHLLAFLDELDRHAQQEFAGQLNKIDWQEISTLLKDEHAAIDWSKLAENAEPAPAIELDRAHPEYSRRQATERGEQLLREGKVAMILVAGGQGTRLGFDRPKGMFPIGPISNKSLFQLLIEKARGTAAYYGSPVPVFIMTSPATHDDTVQFLNENERFGLADEDCIVFCQGTMPAIDAKTGKIILAEKGRLFESPNGHGGMVDALVSGELNWLARMEALGIEYVFYGQIDNPLLQVCDPLTLGYHELLSSEMSTQVVRKTSGTQKVGNVVSVDGTIQIIEYSDLPENVAIRKDDQGHLRLWAGSIAVHVMNREFLSRAASQAEALPFHRALKKVPFVDGHGQLIEPAEPNAIKFEKFIFDLLPIAKNALAIEIRPRDGFAAVKNASGAKSETAETAKAALIDLHRRWLDHCGVHVEPEATIEISPVFAVNQTQLAGLVDSINTVLEPTYFGDN